MNPEKGEENNLSKRLTFQWENLAPFFFLKIYFCDANRLSPSLSWKKISRFKVKLTRQPSLELRQHKNLACKTGAIIKKELPHFHLIRQSFERFLHAKHFLGSLLKQISFYEFIKSRGLMIISIEFLDFNQFLTPRKCLFGIELVESVC